MGPVGGRMMALLGMFAAVAGMGSGGIDYDLTPRQKVELQERQQRQYKTLLKSKGVQEFHDRELNVTIMARDQKNADRKFANIKKALQDEGLL